MAEDTEVEITIETLTGTVYELRISIFETFLGIKARIQRLEGLPVYQQVLVYNSQVLSDDACLLEQGIPDGARLQLLVAMRGGPIQTAPVTVDDGIELRYDEEEDLGQPLMFWRMWGTKKMGPPRRLKDKEKRYAQPSVCSRPSTAMRREREAMQEKVDKIKGQMREMKRWHSQQLLAQRSQGQLDSLVHQMSSHVSFGTLPRIAEGRSNVVTAQSPGLLAPRKRAQRLGRCDKCGRKTGISSSFPCRCGGSFCCKHRYAEEHSCSFDYKAAGKESLTRENPVVTAPKLPKI